MSRRKKSSKQKVRKPLLQAFGLDLPKILINLDINNHLYIILSHFIIMMKHLFLLMLSINLFTTNYMKNQVSKQWKISNFQIFKAKNK